jgi:hypothetical protein
LLPSFLLFISFFSFSSNPYFYMSTFAELALCCIVL